MTSFGSQKSIDVEIYGYDFEKARTVIQQTQEIMQDSRHGRHRSQPGRELPRSQRGGGSGKAALLGISETDVANAVLFSMNGNGQTDPIIYTDPQNGNEYYISAWLAEEHRKDLTAIGMCCSRPKTASRSC